MNPAIKRPKVFFRLPGAKRRSSSFKLTGHIIDLIDIAELRFTA
ncbi:MULTISPECIES: hypothetical protein [Halomonas]|nr:MULTISPECIES: hypothetical protein [Halomonas]MDR5890366.1 hypothetical protein [Halomonas salina]WJY08144.1 hypothetical protein QWG60_04330 [Halomonas halophila]